MSLNKVFINVEKTLLIIKPEAASKDTEILDILKKDGFRVISRKKIQMTPEVASEFYIKHIEETFFLKLIEAVTKSSVIVYCLGRENAVDRLKQLVGPADIQIAKRTNPNCLRAIYGFDRLRNGLHASINQESADKELRFFFSSNLIIEPLMTRSESENYLRL